MPLEKAPSMLDTDSKRQLTWYLSPDGKQEQRTEDSQDIVLQLLGHWVSGILAVYLFQKQSKLFRLVS